MAGRSRRAPSRGRLRSLCFVSRTSCLRFTEGPTDSFHSPGVKSGIWVSNNSPESLPPSSAPPPRAPPPRLLLPPTVHPHEISDAWSRAEEKLFLVDENSFGKETDGAGGEGSREIPPTPPLVLEQPPQRWGGSGSLCNPFQFLRADNS